MVISALVTCGERQLTSKDTASKTVTSPYAHASCVVNTATGSEEEPFNCQFLCREKCERDAIRQMWSDFLSGRHGATIIPAPRLPTAILIDRGQSTGALGAVCCSAHFISKERRLIGDLVITPAKELYDAEAAPRAPAPFAIGVAPYCLRPKHTAKSCCLARSSASSRR